MYVQRIIQQATPGKTQELLSLSQENCQAMNAAGSPHSLAVRLFTREPAQVTNIRHESLAAYEQYIEKNASDREHQARIRKIGELTAHGEQEMWELQVSPQVTQPPKYSLAVRYFPEAGKAPALRSVLDERIRDGTRGLAGAAIALQVAPPDGAVLGLNLLFASLADMDEFRTANAADPTFQSYVAKTAALCRRPQQQEMLRILQPFPMPAET